MIVDSNSEVWDQIHEAVQDNMKTESRLKWAENILGLSHVISNDIYQV